MLHLHGQSFGPPPTLYRHKRRKVAVAKRFSRHLFQIVLYSTYLIPTVLFLGTRPYMRRLCMGSRSPFPATNTLCTNHASRYSPGLACPAVSRQGGLARLGSSVHHPAVITTCTLKMCVKKFLLLALTNSLTPCRVSLSH